MRHFISRIPSFLFATAAAAYVASQRFVEKDINDKQNKQVGPCATAFRLT